MEQYQLTEGKPPKSGYRFSLWHVYWAIVALMTLNAYLHGGIDSASPTFLALILLMIAVYVPIWILVKLIGWIDKLIRRMW